jgi:hypothetical protein
MTVSPGFLLSIDVFPVARRNLTVARVFFGCQPVPPPVHGLHVWLPSL